MIDSGPKRKRKLVRAAFAAWTAAASLAALLPALVGVPTEFMETDKLVGTNNTPDDEFGISVAVDGDTAVVGAFLDDPFSFRNAGSVYVFRYDGLAWPQEARLIADDPGQFDQFGRSVAVSNDVAMVGAYLSDDFGLSSGSAYFFRYDEMEMDWVQEQKITASDPAAGDEFGFSVAVSGDTAVAGAPLADDPAFRTGAAYVFRYNGVVWEQEQKLIDFGLRARDQFGFSVAVSGGTAVVGAPVPDVEPINERPGSAIAFRYNGNADTWLPGSLLTSLDSADGDEFGFSVAVSGDTAMVGAPDHNFRRGAVYVFGYNEQEMVWEQEQKLTASEPAIGDQFGFSVSVTGDTAVIGAEGAGLAYVFRYDGTDWLENEKLVPSDDAAGFGNSVAVGGDSAVVGAHLDNPSSFRKAGSAFVFAVPEPSATLLHVSALGALAWLTRRRRSLSGAMPGTRASS